MRSIKQFCLVLFCLLSAAGLQARNVWVMPGSGGQTVTVASGDTVQSAGVVQAPNGPFLALTRPDGTRSYVIGRNPNNNLIILDSSLNIASTRSFGDVARAAALTPDGRRLLVLAGRLRLLDTSTEAEISAAQSLDVGTQPSDLAVSLDSTRAFILSPGRVTAVDMTSPNNPVVAGSLAVSSDATGVAVGPNGLVYVSSRNEVIIIDGRTMTRLNPSITMNGLPGKLSFTPDGLRAAAVNQDTFTGASAFVIDLNSKSVSNVPTFGMALESLQVVSNSRAIAYSASGQSLHDVSLSPAGILALAVQGAGSITGVTGYAVSDELPNARYLFYAAGGLLNRVDLATNASSGSLTVSSATSSLSFAGPATTGTAASALQYNNNQVVAASTMSLPMYLRVVDSLGRPLSNIPVSFSPDVSSLVVVQSSGPTNSQGFAYATVMTPVATGVYTLTAVYGSGLVATFTVNVGSAPTGVGGLSIYSGNGQVSAENSTSTEPLSVLVRNADGTPVAGAPVTFAVASGNLSLSVPTDGTCAGLVCSTDSNGRAAINYTTSTLVSGNSYEQATVTATLSTGVSVSFYVTIYQRTLPSGGLATAPLVELLTPSFGEGIRGGVGETIKGAIRARIVAGGFTQLGQPIPNVGIRATTGLDATAGPTASCPATALSDSSGLIVCDLTLGGKTGTTSLSIDVGYYVSFQRSLTVTTGAPASITILQGNNQTGRAGQRLTAPLQAQVVDAAGNALSNIPVSWAVSPAGSVTLSSQSTTTDTLGRASAIATLGSTTGTAQVKLTAGSVSVTFYITITVTVSKLEKISGDGQIASINQAFAQPLVVQVTDERGQAVQGASVGFSLVSGLATLSSSTATTDSQGRAQIAVVAGGAAGSIVINASISNLTTTFSLTARLPGPLVTAADFRNAASGQPGVTPGGIVTITGPGLATGVQGTVVAQLIIGALPTRLSGVEVRFGGVPAPIFAVSNSGGVEQVTVQAPFDLAPGQVTVVVTAASGGSSTIPGVQVSALQPGIFETVFDGQRFGVCTRPDGSFVTPDNPARRGEIIRMYATGLGQVTPATATNRAGIAGQTVLASLVAGVNNEGVRLVSAEYLVGAIGIYEVAFEIPMETTAGARRPLALAAVNPDGSLLFANGTGIPIL